jgi:beta-galactosidase
MRYLFLLAAILSLLTSDCKAVEIVSLAGEWRFALDRTDAGVTEKWFTKSLPDKIQLPGVLQAQGYGNDIATNTPWVLGLGDAWWNIQPKQLREKFSQPGNVKVPFLSQPPKHYLGAAWYQRDIEISPNLANKRFTLFLERAHWKTTVWLDDKEIGSDISLSTPHEYDFGIVTLGKHRVTICVDNRTQLPVAGHLLDSHSISDALGATWNGIVGKIEVRVTKLFWIEDLQTFPNYKTKSVTIKGRIENRSGKSDSAKVSLIVTPFEINSGAGMMARTNLTVTWPTNSSTFQTELALHSDAREWNEFNPTIYRLSVGLEDFDGAGAHFSLREITTQDKDILINGKPINLRTTHFGGDFPLTGYPEMDVASWKKIIQTCKDYGLNGMRFHSWCPPEAAFEAADELGFYLQPECPLWADFGNAPTREFLEMETARILKAYGNHPSFVLFAPSNEPKNYSRYLPQWAATNYAKDNRRLYSAATGWSDPSQVNGGAQFATLVRYGKGQLRNSTGWFGNDYSEALNDVHIPVLSHEVGQWCAYPDFDVMRKFTGYMQPGNYEIFKHIAEQNGVLEKNKEFAFASGRFQLACYKEEIEAALRTPGLAGFQLLDLHDYLGQGTALIGLLDAFWESKGYVTPEEFRKFCAPVVPLAWLKKRVFTTNEKLEADIGLAQFGATELTNALVRWEVQDSEGKIVGQCPSNLARNIPVGFKGKCLDFSMELSQLPAPAEYKLVAKVESGEKHFENDWNFWLYPAVVEDSKANDVLVTSIWADAEKKIADGGKVLFLPTNADLDSAKCPPMKNVPVFWNIQMTVRPPQNRSPRFDAMLGLLCETNHPALAAFPTDKNCDWQWTPLINGVRSVNLTDAPRELKPIVWAIDDWNRNWKLGVIFECNVGTGKLMVSAINLNNERGSAGLKQLRRSLLDYMGGEKFLPTATLTPEQARALWTRGATATNEPARVFDPDLNDGSIPAPKTPKR